MKRFASILLAGWLAAFAVSSWGAVFEVRNSSDLREALNIARQNGESDTIKIYQGIYYGRFEYQEGSSEETFYTKLLGGYSEVADRTNDASKTVLDGQQLGRVLSCTIQGSLMMENITIQNGLCDGAGGGLVVSHHPPEDRPGMVYLRNNIIRKNHSEKYAGGLWVESFAPEGVAGNIYMYDNVISGNSSGSYEGIGGGGAFVYVLTGSRSVPGATSRRTCEIMLLGNSFTENRSNSYGGGAHILTRAKRGPAGPITLVENSFTGNRVEGKYYGGGIFIESESLEGTGASDPITLENNTITENSTYSPDSTVGSSNWGGGVSILSTSSDDGVGADIILRKNTISGNGGTVGGGIDAFTRTLSGRAGDIILSGNTVSQNSAVSYGGGISAESDSFELGGVSGDIIFTNNMFAQNSSEDRAGGALIASASYGFLTGNVIFTNNTVSGNVAVNRGGGVYLKGDEFNTLDVYNNIIWGNTAAEGRDMVLYCSGTFNGFNNDFSDVLGGWTHHGGNINQNPRFVSSTDYHLQFSSPCRNAGAALAPELPPTDYDGQNRIIGSAPDMGADEIAYIVMRRPMPLH